MRRRRSPALLGLLLCFVGAGVVRAAAPERIAVLPLTAGPGVKAELAEVITDAFASALAGRPELSVVSSKDVQARLGFERQQQLLGGGCGEDTKCVAAIGNALGVEKMAFGSLARLGGSAVLNITVLELHGSGVVRHTERVRSETEEGFLDAIAPSMLALFPAATPEPSAVSRATGELEGTHLHVSVRGQLSPLAFPSGAFVVSAAWNVNESFQVGAGAIVARPFGVQLRGTWVPFNAAGRLRPLVSVEVPLMFSAAGPSVGVGGSLGAEFRILRAFAIGAEIPISYQFGGPADAQRFWVFGALTVSGRI